MPVVELTHLDFEGFCPTGLLGGSSVWETLTFLPLLRSVLFLLLLALGLPFSALEIVIVADATPVEFCRL